MPAATRSAKRADSSPVSEKQHVEEEHVIDLQREVIELFVRAAKILGLPKSIGEIYGLLYISEAPLPLDSIVAKLGISKGSASQGLRFLRKLGAIEQVDVPRERRDHFSAVAELKPLATGFIRGELLPHLESGARQLDKLGQMVAADQSPNATFNKRRIARLQAWSRRGGGLLRLVEKFLR